MTSASEAGPSGYNSYPHQPHSTNNVQAALDVPDDVDLEETSASGPIEADVSESRLQIGDSSVHNERLAVKLGRFLVSPIFVFIVLSICVSLMRLGDTRLRSNFSITTYILWFPRGLLLPSDTVSDEPKVPNTLPFLGTAPWNEAYGFDPEFPLVEWRPCENSKVDKPYNSTLKLKRFYSPGVGLSHSEFRTNDSHFGVDFESSRCANTAEIVVSGFYGQGAYLTWLVTAAFSIYHHEQQQFLYIPDDTALETFKLRNIQSIDREMIAAMAYYLIAMVDFSIRIIRRENSATTYAALQVVSMGSLMSRICFGFWCFASPHYTGRHLGWGFFWILSLVILSSRLMIGVQPSAQDAYSSLYWLSIIFMLFIPPLFLALGLVLVSLYGLCAKDLSGESRKRKLRRMPIWMYFFTKMFMIFCIGFGYKPCAFLGDCSRYYCLESVPCNALWISDLFPLGAPALYHLDQAAGFAAAMAILFRGLISRLYARPQRRSWASDQEVVPMSEQASEDLQNDTDSAAVHENGIELQEHVASYDIVDMSRRSTS